MSIDDEKQQQPVSADALETAMKAGMSKAYYLLSGNAMVREIDYVTAINAMPEILRAALAAMQPEQSQARVRELEALLQRAYDAIGSEISNQESCHGAHNNCLDKLYEEIERFLEGAAP